MKNEDNDEVQELIGQLKSLQLQQTKIVARLEIARRKEARASTEEVTPLRRVSVDENRKLAIGDKVRIKNPSPFQSNRGTVIKIGDSRVMVLTKSGKITRAPKNLTIEDE
jgi:hypothetical protein